MKSVKQLIKLISTMHSMPIKTGQHGWHLYHPWDIEEYMIGKNGATTQSSTSGSYWQTLSNRRGYIAYDVVQYITSNTLRATDAMNDVTEQGKSLYDAVMSNIK